MLVGAPNGQICLLVILGLVRPFSYAFQILTYVDGSNITRICI
jgi:hypothetical protein